MTQTKIKFNQSHMTELENAFFLSEDQKIGLDASPQNAADLLNTFNWAMLEGDSTICYVGYDDEKEFIGFINAYCESRNIDYNIINDGKYYTLVLH